MGQAYRAPFDSYTRNFWITHHAVERLRERLTEVGRTEHRDDRDLANYLDACIHAAVRAGRAEILSDRDGPAWVVDIDPEIRFPLVAILKRDKVDRRRRACVTVLSKDMVSGTLGER